MKSMHIEYGTEYLIAELSGMYGDILTLEQLFNLGDGDLAEIQTKMRA